MTHNSPCFLDLHRFLHFWRLVQFLVRTLIPSISGIGVGGLLARADVTHFYRRGRPGWYIRSEGLIVKAPAIVLRNSGTR